MLVPLLTPDADLDGLLHEACREHDGIYNARLLGGGHYCVSALWERSRLVVVRAN